MVDVCTQLPPILLRGEIIFQAATVSSAESDFSIPQGPTDFELPTGTGRALSQIVAARRSICEFLRNPTIANLHKQVSLTAEVLQLRPFGFPGTKVEAHHALTQVFF